MFKANFNRTLALVLGSITLSFAAGCVNEVTGPVATHTSTPIAPQPPKSEFDKTGIQPTITSVPGDITGDGVVDASDLAAFAFLMRADVNLDGTVDQGDQAMLQAALSNQVPDLVTPFGLVDASDIAAWARMRPRVDLNGDGLWDARDASVFAWMLGRADLNHDGVVDRHDRDIITVVP
jgi:hypothetical protein